MSEAPKAPSWRIGYVRVSTDDQDLSLQLSAMEKAGVDRVVQEKASGATMNRPGWASVRREVRSGDTIVIWKMDRLGRSVNGVLNEIEELEAQGIEIEVLTEGFDTKTPSGRMMRSILLSFAQMERELISERTKAGMAARRAKGHVFGRRKAIADQPARIEAMRPYVADGRIFTIPPREALAVLNGENGQDDKLRARLRKLPKIESEETFRRWRRQGFPGLIPQPPTADEEERDDGS